MISTAVASRYANALADAVLAPASGLDAAQAIDQLRSFNAVYQASPDLRSVLASPAVSAARKQAVVKDIATALGVATIIRNFVLVLSDHRRVAAFGQIVEGFESALDDRLGFVRAEVRSAFALNERQREELSAELSGIAGAKMRIRFETDPELIGGVAARIGSKVYDGSVRGQLAGLRERLAATI
jgi:F-type H+-transporting ATPase subunit delta